VSVNFKTLNFKKERKWKTMKKKKRRKLLSRKKELRKLIAEQRMDQHNFNGNGYIFNPNSKDIYDRRRRNSGSGFSKK